MSDAASSTCTQPTERGAFLTRQDVAGAFGDVGVLFPIAIALITFNHFNPTALFLAAGLTYILAGCYFRIPISVQPLKAMAAIALTMKLQPSTIASAGVVMAVLLAIAAVTNCAELLARFFTLPIIRGIQLGLGLLLVSQGAKLIAQQQVLVPIGKSIALPGWVFAFLGGLLLLIFINSRHFPAALVLLAFGITAGLCTTSVGFSLTQAMPQRFELLTPRIDEMWSAFLILVIPQLPLTFGNSIVATKNTAEVLFRDRAQRVTIRSLGISVAIANLFSGFILAAPLCHGSGGVTAHHKFGARSVKSSFVIGVFCLALALTGRAAVSLLQVIPGAVFGLFLVYVGIQHAAFVRDLFGQTQALMIAAVIGAVSCVTANLTMGFLGGLLIQGIFMIIRWRSLSQLTAFTNGTKRVFSWNSAR